MKSAIYNKSSRDLPPLEAGDHVRIYKDRQWRKAEVLPRSYIVRDERGQVFRRNRRHILATPNDPPIVVSTPAIPMVSEHQNTTVPGQPAVHVARKSPNNVPIRTPAVPGQPAVHIEQKSPNHAPIRTRSGREVKKLERLIEHK